jgi:hypothetical protein
MRARFHPLHRPVVSRLEPAPEIESGRVGRIRTRKAAGDKAEARCFRPYCFFKLLALNHRRVLHALVGFPQEFQCFDRLRMM